MAVTDSALAFLKDALPFWNKLTVPQQRELQGSATTRGYRRSESLHNGSADCSGLFIVKSGQLRVFILSQAGKEITLYRLFERDICIFSASCIMKNISFDVYIDAEQDGEILIIPTKVYDALNHSSLEVSDYTNQLISSHFSDVMWVMEQVLFTSFDKRLANFLLEQATIDGSDTLGITHDTIAKHLGSAREVVTRMLKYFHSEGMVALSRGGITITDRTKLEEMAASA